MKLNLTKSHRVLLVIGICAIAATSLMWWAISGMMLQAIPTMNYARTTSMDIVTIRLTPISGQNKKEERTLRIPKAYLTDTDNWKGGSQQRLWIESALPDLVPSPWAVFPQAPIGTPERAKEEMARANAFNFTLRTAASDWVNFDKSFADSMTGAGLNGSVVNLGELHGLRRIREVPCLRKDLVKKRMTGEDNSICDIGGLDDQRYDEYLYAFDDSGNAVTKFWCQPDFPGPIRRGVCRGQLLESGVVVEFSFRRTELARWSEFVVGIRKLIKSFL